MSRRRHRSDQKTVSLAMHSTSWGGHSVRMRTTRSHPTCAPACVATADPIRATSLRASSTATAAAEFDGEDAALFRR